MVVEIKPYLQDQLSDMRLTVKVVKTTALSPPGFARPEVEIGLIAGVGVSIASAVSVVVQMPVGSDTYAENRAVGVIHEGEVERLAKMLVHMPDG